MGRKTGGEQRGPRENGGAGNTNYVDIKEFMITYLCVPYVANYL